MRCHSDSVYHARFPRRSRVRGFARKDNRRSDRIEAFRFKLADMPAVDSVCAFRLNRFERHLIHAVPRLFVGRENHFDFPVLDFFVRIKVRNRRHNRRDARFIVRTEERVPVRRDNRIALACGFCERFVRSRVERIHVRRD